MTLGARRSSETRANSKLQIHAQRQLLAYMGKLLKGIGASSGTAEGTVRIISENATEKFDEGDILVTEMTNPAMVPMMRKAGAIICDIGGMTSHPAIVARETGIPCVVGTKIATKILKKGMRVIVDGKKGEIFAIE